VFNAPLLKQTNYLAKFGTFQNDDKKNNENQSSNHKNQKANL